MYMGKNEILDGMNLAVENMPAVGLTGFMPEEIPRPLWEIPIFLKCPVVGTCLPVSGHQKVLKKHGYDIRRMRDYDMHRVIMAHLSEENPVSRSLDRYLRKLYRKELDAFFSMPPDELMAAWRKESENGIPDFLLYIAAVRQDLSEEFLDRIYGEVHMAGHTNTRALFELKRDNNGLRKSLSESAAELDRQKRITREMHRSAEQKSREIRAMSASLSAWESKYQALVEETRQRPDHLALMHTIENLEDQLDRMSQQIAELGAENRKLRSGKERLEQLQRDLFQELDALIHTDFGAGENHSCEGHILSTVNTCRHICCPRHGTCEKRRVLVVGGMTHLERFYRKVVEASGGEFEYHDGYLRKGTNRLSSQVSRCDLVLCPVTCNSHGACLQVKALCKKHGKPFKMLSGSGLNTICMALKDDTNAAEAEFSRESG